MVVVILGIDDSVDVEVMSPMEIGHCDRLGLLARWELEREKVATHSVASVACILPIILTGDGRSEINARLKAIARKLNDDGRVMAASCPLPPPLHIAYNPSENYSSRCLQSTEIIRLGQREPVRCLYALLFGLREISLRASDSVGTSEPQVQNLTKPVE